MVVLVLGYALVRIYLQFFTKSEKRYVFKTVETQNLNGIELKCKQTTCGILFLLILRHVNCQKNFMALEN